MEGGASGCAEACDGSGASSVTIEPSPRNTEGISSQPHVVGLAVGEDRGVEEVCVDICWRLPHCFTNVPVAAPLVRFVCGLLRRPNVAQLAWRTLRGSQLVPIVSCTLAGENSLRWLLQQGFAEEYLFCLEYFSVADPASTMDGMTALVDGDLALFYRQLLLPGRVFLAEGGEHGALARVLRSVVRITSVMLGTASTAQRFLRQGLPSPIAALFESVAMIPLEQRAVRLRVVHSHLQIILASMRCTRQWVNHYSLSGSASLCLSTCVEWCSLREDPESPLSGEAETLFDIVCMMLAVPDAGCEPHMALYHYCWEAHWNRCRAAGVAQEASPEPQHFCRQNTTTGTKCNNSIITASAQAVSCDSLYQAPACQYGVEFLVQICVAAKKVRPVLFLFLARLLLRVVHHSCVSMVEVGLVTANVANIISEYVARVSLLDAPQDEHSEDPWHALSSPPVPEVVHRAQAPMRRQREEEALGPGKDSGVPGWPSPLSSAFDDLGAAALDAVALCTQVCSSPWRVEKEKNGAEALFQLVVSMVVHPRSIVMRATVAALQMLPAMSNEVLLFTSLARCGFFNAVMQRLKRQEELPEKLMLLRLLRHVYGVAAPLRECFVDQADGVAVLMRRVAGVSHVCLAAAANLFSAASLGTADATNRVCSSLGNLIIPCDWLNPSSVISACWALQCTVHLVAREPVAKVFFSRLLPSLLDSLESLTPVIATTLASLGGSPSDLSGSYDGLWEWQRHDKRAAEVSPRHHYLLLIDALLLHLHMISLLLIGGSVPIACDAGARLCHATLAGPLLECRLYTSVVVRGMIGMSCWSCAHFFGPLRVSRPQPARCEVAGACSSVTLQDLRCGWSLACADGDSLFHEQRQRVVQPHFLQAVLRALSAASRSLAQALTSVSVIDLICEFLAATAENCYALAEVRLLKFTADQLTIITEADPSLRDFTAKYITLRAGLLAPHGFLPQPALLMTQMCLSEQRSGNDGDISEAVAVFDSENTLSALDTWRRLLCDSLPCCHPSSFVAVGQHTWLNSRLRSLCVPVSRWKAEALHCGGVDIALKADLIKSPEVGKRTSVAIWFLVDGPQSTEAHAQSEGATPGRLGHRSSLPRPEAPDDYVLTADSPPRPTERQGPSDPGLRCSGGQTALVSLFFDETRVCLQVIIDANQQTLLVRQSVKGTQHIRSKQVVLENLPPLPRKQWCLLTCTVDGIVVQKGSLRAKVSTTVHATLQTLYSRSCGGDARAYQFSEVAVKIETDQGVTDRSYNPIKELSFACLCSYARGVATAGPFPSSASTHASRTAAEGLVCGSHRILLGSAMVLHGSINRLESAVLFALGSDNLFAMGFLDRTTVVHQYPVLARLTEESQGASALVSDLSVLASLWLRVCGTADEVALQFSGADVPFAKISKDRIVCLFGVSDGDAMAWVRLEDGASSVTPPPAASTGVVAVASALYGSASAFSDGSSSRLNDLRQQPLFDHSVHVPNTSMGEGGILSVSRRKRLTLVPMHVAMEDEDFTPLQLIHGQPHLYTVTPVYMLVETVGGAPFFLWLASFQAEGSPAQLSALSCALSIMSVHCGEPLRGPQRSGGSHMDNLLSALLHTRIGVSAASAEEVLAACGTRAVVRADLLSVVMDFTLWSQDRSAFLVVLQGICRLLKDETFGFFNAQLFRQGYGGSSAVSTSFAVEQLLLHLHMHFGGDTQGVWDVSMIPYVHAILLRLCVTSQVVGRILHSALWLVTEEQEVTPSGVREWALGLLDVALCVLKANGRFLTNDVQVRSLVNDVVAFFKSGSEHIRRKALELLLLLGFTAEDGMKVVGEYKARAILYPLAQCVHHGEVHLLVQVVRMNLPLSAADLPQPQRTKRHVALLVSLLPLMQQEQKNAVLGMLSDVTSGDFNSTAVLSTGADDDDALSTPIQYHLFQVLKELTAAAADEAESDDMWANIEQIARVLSNVCLWKITAASREAKGTTTDVDVGVGSLIEDSVFAVVHSAMSAEELERRADRGRAFRVKRITYGLVLQCVIGMLRQPLKPARPSHFRDTMRLFHLVSHLVFLFSWCDIDEADALSEASSADEARGGSLRISASEGPAFEESQSLRTHRDVTGDTGGESWRGVARQTPHRAAYSGPRKSLDNGVQLHTGAPVMNGAGSLPAEASGASGASVLVSLVVSKHYEGCFGEIPGELLGPGQAWRLLPFVALEAAQRLAFELRVNGGAPTLTDDAASKLVCELMHVQWRLATFILSNVDALDSNLPTALALLHLVGAGGAEYGYAAFTDSRRPPKALVVAPHGSSWSPGSLVLSPHAPLLQLFELNSRDFSDFVRDPAPWLLLLHAAAGHLLQSETGKWNRRRALVGQSLSRLILYNPKVWQTVRRHVMDDFVRELEALSGNEVGALSGAGRAHHRYRDPGVRRELEFTPAGLDLIRNFITTLRTEALTHLQLASAQLDARYPTLAVDPRRAVQIHEYINANMQQLQNFVWKNANYFKKQVEEDGFAMIAAYAAPRFGLLPWWGHLSALYTRTPVPLDRWELDRAIGPEWQRVRLRRIIHEAKMSAHPEHKPATLPRIDFEQRSPTDDVTLLQSFSVTGAPQVLSKRVLRSDSTPIRCQLILPMDRVPILLYMAPTTISYVVEWFQHTLVTVKREQGPLAGPDGGVYPTDAREPAAATELPKGNVLMEQVHGVLAPAQQFRRGAFAVPYNPDKRIPAGFRYKHEIPCFRRVVDVSSIRAVWPRRNLLKPNAVEIVLDSGETLFLALESEKVQRRVIEAITAASRQFLDKTLSFTEGNLKMWRAWWLDGRISNFKYLMYLNLAAGRSYGDLRQYPVFPHVIADFVGPQLDLTRPQTFRRLDRPMGAQTEEREERAIAKYNELLALHQESVADGAEIVDLIPHHYGSHYSPLGGTLHYLVRLQPFADYFLDMNSKLDDAGRVFASMATAYSISSTGKDVKELVPEFYSAPQMYLNSDRIPFGTKQDGDEVNDVILPPWAESARHFTVLMRQALECRLVSERLHQWIDLIFGFKQRGKEAITAVNVFHALTYSGTVDLASVEDKVLRRSHETQIDCFGQTPQQLFTAAHKARVRPSDASYAQSPCPTVRFDSSLSKSCVLLRVESCAPSTAFRVESNSTVVFCRAKPITAALGAGETGDWTIFTAASSKPSTFPAGAIPFTIVNDQAKDVLSSRGGNLVLLDAKDPQKELACFCISTSHITCFATDAGVVYVGTASGSIHVVQIAPEEVSELEIVSSSSAAGARPLARKRVERRRVQVIPLTDARANRVRSSVLRRACVLHGHTAAVLTLFPSPEWGVLVSSGDDGVVALWDVRRRVVMRTIPGPSLVAGLPSRCLLDEMRCSRGAERRWRYSKVALNAREGDIFIAGTTTDGEERHRLQLFSLNGDAVQSCDLPGDAAGALLTVGGLVFVGRFISVLVLDAKTLHEVHLLTHPSLEEMVTSITINPTATVLAACDRNGNVVTWKMT